jgi:hypothetical protein
MRILRRLQRAALRNSRRGASVFRATTIAAALSAVALSGCVEDSSSNDGDGAGAIDQKSIGLRAFNACAPLLDYYQAEAIAELEQGWDVGQPIAVGRDVPAAEPGIGAPTNDSAGGQGAAGGEDGGDNGGGAVAGVDYSETNNQEQGVDEPDIVKTDGEHIYTVRGGRLLIYAAGDLSLVGEAVLYGTWDSSQELLVRGDQAVVLGSHWGVPEEDFGDAEPEPGYRTIVAIYDISDRANPSLVRRLYVDGGLVAGRLTGRTARVATAVGPRAAGAPARAVRPPAAPRRRASTWTSPPSSRRQSRWRPTRRRSPTCRRRWVRGSSRSRPTRIRSRCSARRSARPSCRTGCPTSTTRPAKPEP